MPLSLLHAPPSIIVNVTALSLSCETERGESIKETTTHETNKHCNQFTPTVIELRNSEISEVELEFTH
jgi:hypothetical protein